jgi:hypothetical protein
VEAPLTLSAETGIAFFMAFVVIYAVGAVKLIFEKVPWFGTWTNNIPGWVWIVTAMVIGMGICWVLKLDQIGKLFQAGDVSLPYPLPYLATGAAIAFSSNVMYMVAKPLKKKKVVAGKVVCVDDVAVDGQPQFVVVPPTNPDKVTSIAQDLLATPSTTGEGQPISRVKLFIPLTAARESQYYAYIEDEYGARLVKVEGGELPR